MEWYEILLLALLAMILLVFIMVVSFKDRLLNEEYLLNRRKNLFITRKVVMKQIKEEQKRDRNGTVIDGQIEKDLIAELENLGYGVEPYIDFRGYPCVRISFTK